MDPIVERSRRMIRKGSKSFAGAARLMSPPTRESVYMLYAWCRHCDDRIDQQELGHQAPTTGEISARERLAEITERTTEVLAGKPVDHPAFAALGRVVRAHRIPHQHPLELLHGFEMDVEERRYESIEQTLDYCYHVAGVVGVMMSYVMGVREREVLDRAADLGMALQMTNIARDVMDDAADARVYLPRDWLAEAGVPIGEINKRRHREKVLHVVRRLLAEADLYYASADEGLPWLPLSSAWAVATARGVYRDIGRLVLRRGAGAWDERAVVGRGRKLLRVFAGAFDVLRTRPLGRGRPPGPREGLWKRPETSS